MTNIVTVNLDYERMKRKPTNIDILSNRIVKFPAELNIQDLAEAIGDSGRAFTPATFINGGRKKEHFKSQQLFALDFDETISWDKVRERANRYRLPISFAYETFSAEDKNRFRVVFKNDIVIDNAKVAEIIIHALAEIFPECDPQCREVSRLFFGGKGVFYLDKKAEINIINLMFGMVSYHRDKDSKNYNRNIRRYAENVGLSLLNNLPHVVELSDKGVQSEETAGQPIYIIYIGDHAKSSISKCYAVYLTNTVKRVNRYGNNVYDITSIKSTKKDLIERFDYNALATRCGLFAGFLNGSHWCYYRELWGIATNLCQIKGGQKKFMGILNSGVNEKWTTYQDKDWGYHLTYISKMDYLPQQCDNFCPYAGECEHGKNMITTAKPVRNTISVLKDNTEYVSLAESEKDLEEIFVQVQGAEDDNIHIIKGQTGIGKSKMYIDMLDNADKPYIVAVPTHRLKNEIYTRCKFKGYDVIVTPKLPDKLPEKIETEINRLYSIGAGYAANKYIRKIAEEKNLLLLQEYVDDLDKAKTFEGHIITTHDRFIYFQDISNHNVIIDEDIIKVLLKIDSVKVGDLLRLQDKSCIHPFDQDEVDQKINHVLVERGRKQVFPVAPITLADDLDMQQTMAEDDTVDSNAMGFLKSCVAYRYNPDPDKQNRISSDSDVITYVVRHNLPNSKIIILSATANEEIYKTFFGGDRIKFYECKPAKYVGELIQYPARSFSRHCILTDEELLKSAKEVIGDLPVITFKSFKEDEADLNFGGVEGHNVLDGEDIAVVGTPHLNELVYKLYAVALGIDIADSEMRYQEIKRNHFRFYFMTYNNPGLRNIQLWLIESELEQAIGRARLLRNKKKVYLFSNLPLPQADFFYSL